MAICCALLKHGYSNFSLEILEYCEPEKLLIREKYYIDLGSDYNIIKDPTLPPMSGRKHSEKTKQIMSDAKKEENNPWLGKNHTDESKTIMSDAKKGKKKSDVWKNS
jgi:group I intron endonuclease